MAKNDLGMRYQCPECKEDMTKDVLKALKDSRPWYSIMTARDRASVVVLTCSKGHTAKYSLD